MMTPTERKEKLGRGGPAEIARRTGRSRTHVYYVLVGVRRDPAVEEEAVRLLREKEIFVTVADVFGTPSPLT